MSKYFVSSGGIEHAVVLSGDGSVSVDGSPVGLDIRANGQRGFTVLEGGESTTIVAYRSGSAYHTLVNGLPLTMKVESEREKLLEASSAQTSPSGGSLEVLAPMPALVVRVEVSVGSTVNQGDGLLVLEAMKMENELKASHPGTVQEIFISQGDPVEKGQMLMLLKQT